MDFATAFLDPTKARSRRLVGIDYGTTKVGFALSDYGRGTLRDLRSFRIKSQRGDRETTAMFTSLCQQQRCQLQLATRFLR